MDVCKLAPLRILRWYFSATDANALLGRGEMFVVSSEQLWRLFGEFQGGTLLDIGAGSGQLGFSYFDQCFGFSVCFLDPAFYDFHFSHRD